MIKRMRRRSPWNLLAGTLPCLMALLAAAPVSGAEPPVVAAAFSHDGNTLVVGSQHGLQRRSWPALAPLAALTCELSHVHDVAFSPQGDILAAVGGSPAESGSIQLFSWPDAKSLGTFKLSTDVFYHLAWRADGRQIALAASDGRVVLIDRDGHLQGELVGHSGGVTAVAYLNDSLHLVSVGLDRTLRVWNLQTQELHRQMNHHTQSVRDLALKPNDASGRHLLATASDDGTVRLWWPLVGRLVRFARLPSPVLAIAWSPDGSQVLAACRDGHLRVIDPVTVKILADVPVSQGWVHSIAAADAKFAAVGGSAGLLKRVAYK